MAPLDRAARRTRTENSAIVKLPQLEDLPPVEGTHVLVRCDFNVPITAGRIDDDLRIRSAVPTLRWLSDRGAKVTACTHLGRPKGRPDSATEVGPVRSRLAELAPGVELLDNLRWSAGEEANDPAFVDRLVAGQDAYVDDAFGAAHRAHASVVGPPTRLPSAAGRLLANEVEVLSSLLTSPPRPFLAVLGGSKVSDKLGVITVLLEKVDALVIGGGMCFTFLAARGHGTGDSLVEPDYIERCGELLCGPKRIVLPSDLTLLGPAGEVRQAGADVPEGWKGVDIGPGSAAEFSDEIAEARTILWNGPMGVFEDPRFAAGTRTVAEAVAHCGGFSVVGGGDSAKAIAQWGLDSQIDHVSTGGGAMLEFIEQGDLPGLRALREAAQR